MLLRFTEWLEKGFEEPCVEGNNSFTTKLVRSSSPDATFQVDFGTVSTYFS